MSIYKDCSISFFTVMGGTGFIEKGWQERLTEKFVKISCDCGNRGGLERKYTSASPLGSRESWWIQSKVLRGPVKTYRKIKEYRIYGISAELIGFTVEQRNDQLISLTTTRYANSSQLMNIKNTPTLLSPIRKSIISVQPLSTFSPVVRPFGFPYTSTSPLIRLWFLSFWQILFWKLPSNHDGRETPRSPLSSF